MYDDVQIVLLTKEKERNENDVPLSEIFLRFRRQLNIFRLNFGQ